MRFSIQEAGKAKKFFHLPADAQKETGVHHSLIKGVLARNNSSYHRKSDKKLFLIQTEPAVKLLTVRGKDFFFLEEIQQEFGLSPTVFTNQIKNQKFPHEIDWISPEILSPGESVSEAKNEKSEVEFLREKFDELISNQEKMQKETDFLSSRVLQLEKEKQEKKEKEKEEVKVPQERKSSPEKIKETSPPEKEIPFDTSKTFSADTFDSEKNFATFCRFGIIGRITVNGPRKNNTIFLNEKIIYVPDFLKELITKHIKDLMYKQDDKDALTKFMEQYILMPKGSQKKADIKRYTKRPWLVGRIRRCNEEIIHVISSEFMKLV